MSIILTSAVKNLGTASTLIVAHNLARKKLTLFNSHASQTAKYKFGAALVTTDVTEVQLITFSNTPDAGQFILRWNGIDTAAILFSDDAAAVQVALRAVTGLASITVSGSFAAGFTVSLVGATPNIDADLPLLTVTSSTLNLSSVLTAVTVAETVKGKFIDGVVIPAATAITFEGEACPGDALYMNGSGADTRVHVLEG